MIYYRKTLFGSGPKLTAVQLQAICFRSLAHNTALHDLIIVGNQAQNTIEGYGIWENPAHAAALEDTQDFAAFMADVINDLAEPCHRNDLDLLYCMNPKP